MGKRQERDPKFEALETVFFDFCWEYGNDRISLDEYNKYRGIYDKIRQRIMGASVGHDEIPPKYENMIQIPAGDFIMGSSKEEIKHLISEMVPKYPQFQLWFFEDEMPKRKANLGTIWMDKFEVTNLQYSKFLSSQEGSSVTSPRSWDDRKVPPGKGNHPVTGVDKFQASAYCKFLGKRLPTEAEWEKAARGTNGNIYTWGNNLSVRDVNTAEIGRHDTTEVGTMRDDVSPYGILDMGGNVMELVIDGYKPYPDNDAETEKAKRAFVDREGWAVARGSSYEGVLYDARGANRRYFSPSHQGKDIGFRCTTD